VSPEFDNKLKQNEATFAGSLASKYFELIISALVGKQLLTV
jgi:hypothetical protein